MAQGINTLTEEEVGADDLINNIKISRCLFYVSEVLEDVIHGGVTKSKRKAYRSLMLILTSLQSSVISSFLSR